jgi:DTW domain
MRLPFAVDIILDDRRTASSGVQLATLFREMDSNTDGECRLVDKEKGGQIPDYNTPEQGGVFLLFPGPLSRPISSLFDDRSEAESSANTVIQRLVVLDCKWSQSSIREDPALAKLPQLRLDNTVPIKSRFWRWHNEGDGMLSTVEAIYYSAWDVATYRDDWSDEDRANLVHMLWLFGVQREIIQRRYKEGKVRCYKQEPRPPITDEYKDFHRKIRSQRNASGSTAIE